MAASLGSIFTARTVLQLTQLEIEARFPDGLKHGVKLYPINTLTDLQVVIQEEIIVSFPRNEQKMPHLPL